MKSILQQDPERCYLCGVRIGPWRREEHHIFGGPNRRLSERYGLKVYLCPGCHRGPRDGVHFNAGRMRQLHMAGQRAFAERYPRIRFREVFGKNYLENETLKTPPAQSDTGLDGIIWLEEREGE